MITQHWSNLVADKKQRQVDSIPEGWRVIPPSGNVLDVTEFPETCGLLSSKECEITTTEVKVLLDRLALGVWSSVEVTTAFCKRAIIAHQLSNCLTEIFVDRALARAAEVDDHLRKTGKPMGPLHGLPISLKDQITIKDLETTMGYISWIGTYAKQNAVIVDMLYEAGAVPFVRTNVPQTLMWPETYNLIFGRTTNPHNRSLTSGGSSGGEGALIALCGSPLGVGSDIGGSIRIPAAFCGIYGLRPSYGRIPYQGVANSLEGQDSVPSVIGPLSGTIGGLKAFMQAMIDRKPWLKDPMVIRKAWDQDGYDLVEHGSGKPICFGILWNDGNIVPHPPIIRALEFTKNALLSAGHQVIDWQPIKHNDINQILSGIWRAGASEDYKATTAPTNEPVLTTMALEDDAEESKAGFRPVDAEMSAYQLWQLQKQKRDLRKEYLDHWEETIKVTGTGRPVDAIISPVAPYAAPPHGSNRNADYTMIWNVLDYPALTVPVTKVDPTLDAKKPAHEFLCEVDQQNYDLYDPSTFTNAPVSIQVVGRTLEEEAVIAISEIVDAAIKSFGQSGNDATSEA